MSSLYTVSELTDEIKTSLEQRWDSIQVEGEVSNYRPSGSGHHYFTLKDDDAVLSAVIFRSQATKLPFPIKNGDKIVATGRLSLYAPRGAYQIICNSLQKAGEGDILRILEERKQRLAKEGLFDSENKKPLPLYPKKVAIITSATGAALQDFLRVLQRRNSGVDVLLLPAVVQGEKAPFEIVERLKEVEEFNLAEVIILARGGGSLEDLLPFSDEAVVRRVAKSTVPVITGVGHEIDWALADYAADYRAPTPSAAAEVVATPSQELFLRLKASKENMVSFVESLLSQYRQKLKLFSKEELYRHFSYYKDPITLKVDELKESLIFNTKTKIKEYHHTLKISKTELENASPLQILKQGYAYVSKSTGEPILKSSDVKKEEELTIIFNKGKIKSTVKEILE